MAQRAPLDGVAYCCRLRTGTSQAVPFVAGVVALILENRTDTTPAAMATLLTTNAAQVGRAGSISSHG